MEHDQGTVKKMAAERRKELDKIMEPVQKVIEGLSAACTKVSNMRDKIEAQADDIDKEIDRYYDELQQRLQQQREDLKMELHEASKQKKKEVTLQLEQLEAQLENTKGLNDETKEASDEGTLLIKKQLLIDDVKRITDSYSTLYKEPVQSATMGFIPMELYRKLIPQFGQLSDYDVCPMNCEIDLPRYLLEGFNGSCKVIARDRSNHICSKGVNEVVIQAESGRGDVASIEVKDNKDGSYSASFIANQVGEVKLSVSINGRQIKGSPFNVKVHGKYTTIDKPSKVVNEGGRMGQPWGIAFGRDGMWAVTDDTNHCVWIFDSEDQLVRKFGGKGTSNGKFNRPLGLAFDANNHLYVTDHNNHRVQKFDINGAYLFQFGNQGSGNVQMYHPIGAVVHYGKLYVTVFNDNRILVFQLNGHISHMIKSGDLSKPDFIAVSGNDHLLVSNGGHMHNCISIFTMGGNCAGKFCTRGTGGGQLSRPSGIATDVYGCIFVTEEDKNRVSVFDKDGIFIHSFGSKGFGHGQFSSPTGLAISPTGDIYVSDKGNKRIQIFSA